MQVASIVAIKGINDEPLSNFAFNFNLRRYAAAVWRTAAEAAGNSPRAASLGVGTAGYCYIIQRIVSRRF